jgi:hypothetical protein
MAEFNAFYEHDHDETHGRDETALRWLLAIGARQSVICKSYFRCRKWSISNVSK